MQDSWWKNERWLSALAAGLALGVISVILVRLLGWPLETQIRSGLIAFAFGAVTELIRIEHKIAGLLVFGLGLGALSAFILVRDWGPGFEPGDYRSIISGLRWSGPTDPVGADPAISAGDPGGAGGSGRAPGTVGDPDPPTPDAAEEMPSDTAEPTPVHLSDWLRTSGTTILYRHSAYLPGACPGPVSATGNFVDDGGAGVPAECVGSEWIAFDLRPLLEAGRIERGLTYCVVFRDAVGRTGSHAVGAPGLDAVTLPGRTDAPIGFRVTRRLLWNRVELTGQGPMAGPC